ncbi:MAG: hypothetical protein ACRDST_09385 [Pseudonocardiaceae bacterium]
MLAVPQSNDLLTWMEEARAPGVPLPPDLTVFELDRPEACSARTCWWRLAAGRLG